MVATSTPASTPPGGLGPPPVLATAATVPAITATTPAARATLPSTGTQLFGTPTNPPVDPPKPTMGGLVINDKGNKEPWTGGQPNVGWTDLDTTAPTMPETPNQLRPTNTYSAQNSYNFRKGGLSNKYSRNDDLALFQLELLERFKDEGMDTITYLPHPKVNKMVSVITHHSCFSLETVRSHVQAYSLLYDSYDKSNDKAARKSFLDSLDTQLKNAISKKCRDEDTFTIVWMIFMKTFTSTSHEKYENLKNQIKARKPTQYSGQDLHQLADHFRDDAKVLETAGCYDHNLTLEMVKIFLSAGGSGEKAEDFRFALRDMRTKLDKALTHIKFMSVADQNQYMQDNRFTYQDICEDIESHYQNFKDLGEWLPAKNVPDSKAPPSTFGANLVEDKPLTCADFMTLMHSGFAKKQGACYECGSEGHWKHECPKLKGNSMTGVNSQGQQRQGRKTSNKRTSHSSKKKATSWKIIPPEAGQPETKTSDNGRTFHWCAKCKRWTPSHDTSGHTGKKKESRPPQEANLCLVPDPSCWKVEVASFAALLTQLIVESPMFLLVMFLGGLMMFLMIGDVAVVIGDITTRWNGFVCFVIDYGPMLGQAASQLWTYSAPFLWLLLFVWSIVWHPRPDPEPDGHNCRERRADCRFNRRYNRPCHKYTSIKDYNFHHSYPHHLCERNVFYKRVPQVTERFDQDMNHQLHTASLRVLDSV